MGMGTIYLGDTLPFENKLILIDPSGAIIMSHVKSLPVIGWEAGIMKRGDGRASVVSTSHRRMAAAICFEADSPDLIRHQTGRSADLLIVPVNDWKTIRDIHFRMHAFRAIENGVPLLRAAASELSAAIDPWGRVLGMTDFFASGDRMMTAQVPVGGIPTLYAKTGDVFAWICVVAAVVVTLGFGAIESRHRSVHFLHANEPVSTSSPAFRILPSPHHINSPNKPLPMNCETGSMGVSFSFSPRSVGPRRQPIARASLAGNLSGSARSSNLRDRHGRKPFHGRLVDDFFESGW